MPSIKTSANLRSRSGWLVVSAACLSLDCSGANEAPGPTPIGIGGAVSSAAGNSTTGGILGKGGASSFGGSTATGGTSTTGGSASVGGTGNGGAVTGGATSSGASTGGAATGGRAVGGASSGGASTGGAATGGKAAGGAPSGGTSAGGAATGGRAVGGASTGGAAIGGTGIGGNPTGCNPGAPTPAAGGANYPFPQHRLKSYCVYPATCSDAAVTAAWSVYKSKFLVSGGTGMLRIQRPEASNDTVSEGISYGMLFTVYMNEKANFDALWAYAQAHFDARGLMNWHIDSAGATIGAGSATDADEDIGFALVMADKQWGGYTSVTTAYLAKVLSNDFASDGTIKGGDGFVAVNPSYIAPAFYKAFATYTGNSQWTTVVDKSYQILASVMNATTGLVPDWYSGATGPNFTYDAARTPYRIGNDYCWTGETRAQNFLQQISAFFGGVGAANIKDGYTLSGTATGANTNSVFVGPAGVSGMNGYAPQTALVTGAYARVIQDGAAGTGDYFNLSWALFSNLMMTGNFFNMASP